jgi:hypothetical protein
MCDAQHLVGPDLNIISGGQTGVDRAALDAARVAGLDVSGFCPKGRAAEDGVIPDDYPLTEMAEADPAFRTRANCEAAEATLIMVMTGDRRRWGPGSRLTERHAKHLGRLLHVAVLGGAINGSLSMPDTLEETRAWMVRHNIRVLNIAGPRESMSPGIYRQAYAFLTRLFAV